jgi:hypothetical protein
MDNLILFSSGYLLGYLSSEYKSIILYNSYKYYAIIFDKYEKTMERYSKKHNFYLSGSAIKVPFDVAKKYNIPLHPESNMFHVSEYIVEGKPSYTTLNKIPNPINENKNECDIIISAILYHKNKDIISEKDITNELNSLLGNDGRIIYFDNLKKTYNKVLGLNKFDHDTTEYWIEYMDVFDIATTKLDEGILTLKEDYILNEKFEEIDE